MINDDHYVITHYTGSSKEVIVPDTIWFKPVTIISNSAFYETNVTSVKIGKNIKAIGESAFMNCSDLEKVDCTDITTSDGSNFLIMRYAFKNCNNLEKVSLPDYCGITILDEEFLNCINLKYIYMYDHGPLGLFIGAGDKISYIESRAFSNCTSLFEVSLHDVQLGSNAFEGCTGITKLLFNGYNLNSYFGEGAFSNCTSLKFVLMYDNSTDIPAECFSGCTSLESFDFMRTGRITAIGDNAFKNCVDLSELDLDPYPSEISETAINGCTMLKQDGQSDEAPEVDEQQNTKKSKLAQSTITTGMGVTYKEFVSEYGMPDECYNGKAIYNVGNMQYCIVYGEYGDTFDPYSTDTNVIVEEYGDKNVIIFDEKHLGEEVSYYITMADKLGFDYESTQLQLGAGNHGATWYELKLYYSIYLELVLYFDPDTMTAYGVHGQFYG